MASASCLTELTVNQTLGIKDGVVRVHSGLGLSVNPDEALGLHEGDVGWRGAIFPNWRGFLHYNFATHQRRLPSCT